MCCQQNIYIWRLLNFGDIGGLCKERKNNSPLIFDFQYIYIGTAYQRFQ